jgi:hypothetical protein
MMASWRSMRVRVRGIGLAFAAYPDAQASVPIAPDEA